MNIQLLSRINILIFILFTYVFLTKLYSILLGSGILYGVHGFLQSFSFLAFARCLERKIFFSLKTPVLYISRTCFIDIGRYYFNLTVNQSSKNVQDHFFSSQRTRQGIVEVFQRNQEEKLLGNRRTTSRFEEL